MKVILIILVTASLFAMGCVEDKPDYKQCRDIEIARCELRANCQTAAYEDPIDKQNFNDRFPNFDLDTCIAFAKEHCGTRKLGATEVCLATHVSINDCVDLCVEAILGLGPDPADAGVQGPNACGLIERGKDETLKLPDCDFIQGSGEDLEGERDGGVNPE
jgi:hypothetical protein